MKGSSLIAPMIKRLEGKVAIVTGGATGIGEASARLFAQHGAKVVIADIQDDLAQAVCNDISSSSKESIDISYTHCDVSVESDVQNTIDSTMSKYGKLDIMYSNAGVIGNRDPSIMSQNYESFKTIFDVNVYGALLAGKHAARVMIPENKGSIIYTASVASVIADRVPHAYAISKHALVGLTKNLSAELGEYGIRVNCISPFGVPTDSLRKAFGNMEKRVAQEIISATANLKGVLLGEEDIAEAALFLGSDDSKYVSGLNLVVDGGYSTNKRIPSRKN